MPRNACNLSRDPNRKPITERSREALRAALEDLVAFVGGDPAEEFRRSGMFVQLKLEQDQARACGGVGAMGLGMGWGQVQRLGGHVKDGRKRVACCVA